MSIEINPVDGRGTQALKTENDTAKGPGKVSRIAPGEPVRGSGPGDGPGVRPVGGRERRRSERRRRQVPVLLDTRGNRERRRNNESPSASSNNHQESPRGVDIYT